MSSLTVALLAPSAWACAVCSDPEEVSNLTFGLSTAFLTFLPLMAMGAVGWWLWRRLKALEAEQIGQGCHTSSATPTGSS